MGLFQNGCGEREHAKHNCVLVKYSLVHRVVTEKLFDFVL